MELLELDGALLEAFEEHLDPQYPEDEPMPTHVLGYGEISTVFDLESIGGGKLAYKRMPLFKTLEEAAAYEQIYHEYNQILTEIGLRIPPSGALSFCSKHNEVILYLAQKKLQAEGMGNRLLQRIEPQHTASLVFRVLRELKKVWNFNQSQPASQEDPVGRKEPPALEVGLDGQLSNWYFEAFSAGEAGAVEDDTPVTYIDTSTPLFRKQGQEMLDPLLLLRQCPPILAGLLRLLYAKDVLNRYYDFRLVIIDLLANFYKEGRAELLPALLEEVNLFMADEFASFALAPITEKELKSYYSDDARIWILYQKARSLHRFLVTRIARRRYRFILPGPVQR